MIYHIILNDSCAHRFHLPLGPKNLSVIINQKLGKQMQKKNSILTNSSWNWHVQTNKRFSYIMILISNDFESNMPTINAKIKQTSRNNNNVTNLHAILQWLGRIPTSNTTNSSSLTFYVKSTTVCFNYYYKNNCLWWTLASFLSLQTVISTTSFTFLK